MTDVTRILNQIENGDPAASEQLLPLVYEELRVHLPALEIPDNDATGVSSTITVTDVFEISSMTVNLNIIHDRPSDLEIWLVGPDGSTAVPLSIGDNNVTAFNDSWTDGDWRLDVFDTRKKKEGSLNQWSITVVTQ